ncbi:MAG TPA: prepilin peptidase [Terracidiphilus sp.]|nr:prepilin peptidase [Terracidiphilus sp.]
MIRFLATLFAALAGLAFGSFLNVCVTRWPLEESVVAPRSHCRHCERMLAWWENIPLASWILLRGRCRTCRERISWRYPLVEISVGAIWAALTWRFLTLALDPRLPAIAPTLHWNLFNELGRAITLFIFFWTLIAIAVLDAENFWIPDWLTIPGMVLGIASEVTYQLVGAESLDAATPLPLSAIGKVVLTSLVGVVAAALLILLIRWIYKLLRHREGIGLGDAKLMAMLAAWLGFGGALLAFGVGVVLGAIVALIALALPGARKEDSEAWALRKMPLGTFLCIGGILSGLWGERIITAYRHWAGF